MVKKIATGALVCVGVWALCSGAMMRIMQTVSPDGFMTFMNDFKDY